MNANLVKFLTKLSVDDDLVKAFEKDKEGVMKAADISSEHRALIINKEYAKIQAVLGANYKVATNNIVRAFKK